MGVSAQEGICAASEPLDVPGVADRDAPAAAAECNRGSPHQGASHRTHQGQDNKFINLFESNAGSSERKTNIPRCAAGRSPNLGLGRGGVPVPDYSGHHLSSSRSRSTEDGCRRKMTTARTKIFRRGAGRTNLG